MARGKLLKTKIKEAVLEASLVAESIQLGKEKASQKLAEKQPVLDFFKERLTKMLDRIDPLDAVLVATGTYVIHEVISGTQDLLDTINDKVKNNPLFFFSIFNDPYDVMGGTTPAETLAKFPDWAVWVVSLFISGLLVKFGAEIIQSFGGIGGMISGVLGIA